MKASCMFTLLTVLAVIGSALSAPANTAQNSILTQLQGGSTDGTDSGTSNSGVFSTGLKTNGSGLVSSLISSINALAPSAKAPAVSSLAAYGVPINAPSPAIVTKLTGLANSDQQDLFAALLSEVISPVAGPSQTSAPNTNTAGQGDSSGMTSSSGSRKMLKH